jgi:hypothetical protein
VAAGLRCQETVALLKSNIPLDGESNHSLDRWSVFPADFLKQITCCKRFN